MAAYAQFGYGGFPSASQLLPATSHGAEGVAASAAAAAAASSSSSLVMTNIAQAPALSPAGGVIDCQSQPQGGAASSGALSPDALSQNSNVAAAAAAGGGSLDGSAVVGSTPASGGGSCCENGRPIMTDPVSGQTVCSCQYDSARLALSSYSRLPAAGVGVGVYGTPYPSTDQNPYQSIGVDSSAFYSPLSNPYALKDSATGSEMGAWTSAGLQPTTGYYSYDPMSAYGYGASYDLAARRKNATRESTATLKAWLNEHKKNPYPTKGEKIMLAIITKMTLTQVSTWFANARRRLKKENKMTWEPKNRTDDDDDALVSDDEKDKEDAESQKGNQSAGLAKDGSKDEDELTDEDQKSSLGQAQILRAGFGYPSSGGYHGGGGGVGGGAGSAHPAGYHPYHHQHPAYYQPQQQQQQAMSMTMLPTIEHSDPKNQLGRDCGVPIPATKPKIWSLADTVACKTPPPAAQHPYMGQGQMQQQQQQSNIMTMPQQQQQQSMGSFSGGAPAPYLRAHTTAYGGFLGGTTQQLHTTSSAPVAVPYQLSLHHSSHHSHISHTSHTSNTSSSTSSSSNSSSGTHTPTIPIGSRQVAPLFHHQQSQSHQPLLQPAASQRAMGFPEAQPDTPPQTPPNMKLLSGASSQQQQQPQLLPIASQAPTIATCRSNNFNSSYPMNFSTRFGEYSPRDECSSEGSSSSSLSPQLQQHETIFKPLFKRNQISIAGFVPPV